MSVITLSRNSIRQVWSITGCEGVRVSHVKNSRSKQCGVGRHQHSTFIRSFCPSITSVFLKLASLFQGPGVLPWPSRFSGELLEVGNMWDENYGIFSNVYIRSGAYNTTNYLCFDDRIYVICGFLSDSVTQDQFIYKKMDCHHEYPFSHSWPCPKP